MPEIGPPGSESGGRKRAHGNRPAARLRKHRMSHRPPTGYAPPLDSTPLRLKPQRDTMRTMIQSVVVSILLGGFTGAAAQLPPEITVDRYLLQAEQLMAEEDYKAALEVMDKIMALQKEHNLTLPKEFHSKYAQAAFSAGAVQAVLESVNRYLVEAGREGEFYREALKLLDEAEAQAVREQEIQRIRATFERGIPTEMEFVRITAGEFRMGSTSSEAYGREQPVTQVRISRSFDLGKYEVTQGQW